MLLKTKNQQSEGFTLVEALVATALMSVGFSGSFTLTSLMANSSNEAVIRQKMQLITNQIFEVIETDLANIDDYNLSLKTCIEPVSADKSEVRPYEWCLRMVGGFGAATATESRQIDVSTLADGRKVVNVKLEALNNTTSVMTKRIYDN